LDRHTNKITHKVGKIFSNGLVNSSVEYVVN